MNAGIALSLVIVAAGLAGLALSALKPSRQAKEPAPESKADAEPRPIRARRLRLRKLTVAIGIVAAVTTGLVAGLLAISARGSSKSSLPAGQGSSSTTDDNGFGSQRLQPPASAPSSGSFGGSDAGGFGGGGFSSGGS